MIRKCPLWITTIHIQKVIQIDVMEQFRAQARNMSIYAETQTEGEQNRINHVTENIFKPTQPEVYSTSQSRK